MAKLAAVVETLETVPAQFREHYVARDGKFFLDAEGFTPGMFQEQNRLKNELKNAEVALARYRELGDADSLAQLKASQAKLDQAVLIEKGEVNQLLDSTKRQMNEAHEKETAKLQSEVDRLRGEVKSVLVDGMAEFAIIAEGGDTEFLMPVIRKQTEIKEENGRHRVVVLGSDGQPRVKKDGTEFTVRDLVQELKQDPRYRKVFDLRVSSGSGAPAHTLSGAGGGTAAAQKELLSKLPPTDRLTRARQLGIKS